MDEEHSNQHAAYANSECRYNAHTLNRLSCRTFFIAIWSSAPGGAPLTSFAWNTTPKLPFPMTLQLV